MTGEFDQALQHAVREGIGMAITDIVAKETRRALREREDDLTRWIRAAVQSALKDALQ